MYSEVFDEFNEQGWNNDTKLSLLLDFLDRNDATVVTPEMLRDYLQDVANEENANDG